MLQKSSPTRERKKIKWLNSANMKGNQMNEIRSGLDGEVARTTVPPLLMVGSGGLKAKRENR